MKLSLFVIFSLALVHAGLAYKCYVCDGDENQCGPDADQAQWQECDFGQGFNSDICVLEKTVEDGNKRYRRGCEVASEYSNTKRSRCTNYKRFGVRHTDCVCQTEHCNDSVSLQASVVLATLGAIVAAVFVR